MTFHNVSFPTQIIGGQEVPIVEYGSGGGPGFAVTAFDSGAHRSHRVLRSQAPRDRFNLRMSTLRPDTARTLLDFYTDRRGPWASFRFRDFFDCCSHSAGRKYNTNAVVTELDQIIGTGDGTTTQFQLRKGYGQSEFRLWRNVRLPVDGTVRIALDGVEQASGWSVNTETGVITFTTAPANGEQVTAGFEFEKVVRFVDPPGQALIVQAGGFDFSSVPDLVLIEEPDESPEHDSRPHGGSNRVDPMTESVTLSVASGALNLLAPGVAGLSAYLPEPSDIGDGMDYFLVRNIGTQTLTVRDHQGTSVTTLGSASNARFHLELSSAGTAASWVVTAA